MGVLASKFCSHASMSARARTSIVAVETAAPSRRHSSATIVKTLGCCAQAIRERPLRAHSEGQSLADPTRRAGNNDGGRRSSHSRQRSELRSSSAHFAPHIS